MTAGNKTPSHFGGNDWKKWNAFKNIVLFAMKLRSVFLLFSTAPHFYGSLRAVTISDQHGTRYLSGTILDLSTAELLPCPRVTRANLAWVLAIE